MKIKLIGFGPAIHFCWAKSKKSAVSAHFSYFVSCCLFFAGISKALDNVIWRCALITFWHCVNHMSKISSNWHRIEWIGRDKRPFLLGQMQKNTFRIFHSASYRFVRWHGRKYVLLLVWMGKLDACALWSCKCEWNSASTQAVRSVQSVEWRFHKCWHNGMRCKCDHNSIRIVWKIHWPGSEKCKKNRGCETECNKQAANECVKDYAAVHVAQLALALLLSHRTMSENNGGC